MAGKNDMEQMISNVETPKRFIANPAISVTGLIVLLAVLLLLSRQMWLRVPSEFDKLQLSQFQMAAPESLPISLNLAEKQLLQSGFVQNKSGYFEKGQVHVLLKPGESLLEVTGVVFESTEPMEAKSEPGTPIGLSPTDFEIPADARSIKVEGNNKESGFAPTIAFEKPLTGFSFEIKSKWGRPALVNISFCGERCYRLGVTLCPQLAG